MTSHTVRLLNWVLQVPNLQEYHWLKREIFGEHHYHFDTSNDAPLIIDIGAHIGLATFYFKHLYPDSAVMAFEPHPGSYAMLTQNLEFNRLPRVQAVNQAVFGHPGQLTLYADSSTDQWWSTSGLLPGAWDGTQTSTPYSTTAVTLQDICLAASTKIDLIKIDAEGSECNLLFSSYQHFDHVLRYVVEFHPQKSVTLTDFKRQFPREFALTVVKNNHSIGKNRRMGGLVTVWAQRP